jgi:hypothetical protein
LVAASGYISVIPSGTFIKLLESEIFDKVYWKGRERNGSLSR